MASKRRAQTNNQAESRRVRKRGEFISFLIAAILIVGFFAASHFIFFAYTSKRIDRRLASVTPTAMQCEDLLPLLQNEDPNLRFRAAMALSSCGYSEGVDGLIAFLDSDDLKFREAAALNLMAQERTLVDPPLVEKIKTKQEKIKEIVSVLLQ
ncbi:MAG TPA: HEAT repeat domain-containing protein [Bdellovibrionota bacterium]|nr:HEAT repeat domain-containing protein [Bdellovibrionota bacterium]